MKKFLPFLCLVIFSISVFCGCENADYIPPEEPHLYWKDIDVVVTDVSKQHWYATTHAKGKELYGWHISDLVIYDKPKELTEFFTPAKCPYQTANGCTYNYYCYRAGEKQKCGQIITRPFQSWGYVAEDVS